MKKYRLTNLELFQEKLDRRFGKGLFKAGILLLLFGCFLFSSCASEGGSGSGSGSSSGTTVAVPNPRTPTPRITIEQTGQTATINPEPYSDDDVQRIRSVYFAKKNVTEEDNAPSLGFTKIDSAHTQNDENGAVLPYDSILGKTVYLVIETNNMEGLSIDAVIRPAADTLSGDVASLELMRCAPIANQNLTTYPYAYTQSYTPTTLFTTQVGNTDALRDNRGNIPYVNMDAFRNFAIVKLQLRPATRTLMDEWSRRLGTQTVNLEVVVERTDNEACAYGNGDEEVLGAGVFLNDDADGRFRVVNKNIYEIYHADNRYNFSQRYNPTTTRFVAKRVAKVINNNTEQVVFFYRNQLDNEFQVCTRTQITATSKTRRDTIPAMAQRGALEDTISYQANINVNERIDARVLEIYANGTLGISPSGTRFWYRKNHGTNVKLIDMNVIGTPGMGPQIFEEMHYNQNDIVMRYGFQHTRRRHTKPEVFAGFLGALAQLHYEGHTHYVVSNGFTYEDGSSFPSAEHTDGRAADLYYLNTVGDGDQTFLEDADFDYDNQLIFSNILIGFGFQFSRSQSFNNTRNPSPNDDRTTQLPNSTDTRNPPHNNHLHIYTYHGVEDIYDL